MFSRRVYSLFLTLIVMVAFGTIGYHTIEGWSYFDGLYMTVITLATIGYSETNPLSPGGRVFTLILIVLGVTMVAFSITSLTQMVFEAELSTIFGRRKLFKEIGKLEGHYILCGAGRVGLRIVDELRKKDVDFVVIERDPQVADKLLQQGALVLIGDATDENVLDGANVRTAKGLIAAASTDADNVYIALTAKGINPGVYIVARANDLSGERQLKRAGVDKVVSPALIGSHRMAQAAISPAVADFIDLTTMTGPLGLLFEQVRIEPGSILDGKMIRDSGIKSEHQAMIVAITSADGRMSFNPGGEVILKSGDLLITIGTEEGLRRLSTSASTP